MAWAADATAGRMRAEAGGDAFDRALTRRSFLRLRRWLRLHRVKRRLRGEPKAEDFPQTAFHVLRPAKGSNITLSKLFRSKRPRNHRSSQLDVRITVSDQKKPIKGIVKSKPRFSLSAGEIWGNDRPGGNVGRSGVDRSDVARCHRSLLEEHADSSVPQ